MALYPPLTPMQLAMIESHLSLINQSYKEIEHYALIAPRNEDEVDELLLRVAQMRGAINRFDLAVFRVFGLVHKFRDSNAIQASVATPTLRPKLNLDDLVSI
jgi:hypothetical protein